MVVNLAETDPAGWEQDERPEIRPEDRCVYELHVKDFSSDPHSGISDKHRGKFLAFTEEGTTLNGDGIHATGLDYLKSLGISHVHLLPVFDFGMCRKMMRKRLTGDMTRCSTMCRRDPMQPIRSTGRYVSGK